MCISIMLKLERFENVNRAKELKAYNLKLNCFAILFHGTDFLYKKLYIIISNKKKDASLK